MPELLIEEIGSLSTHNILYFLYTVLFSRAISFLSDYYSGYILTSGPGSGIVTHIYVTLVTKEPEGILGPSVLGIRLVIAVIF